MNCNISRRKPGESVWEIIAQTCDSDFAMKISDFLNKSEYAEFETGNESFFDWEIEELPKDLVELRDCINMFFAFGKSTILNDGKIIGFQQEKIPTQTANPSGDE